MQEKITEFSSVIEALKGNDGVVHEYNTYHNFEAITGYAHEKGYDDFEGNNWSLILTVEKNKILAPLTKVGGATLGIALLAAFLATVLIFLMSRLISRPINDLSQIAKDVAAGDLTKRAEVRSKDEIGQLAESFNQMTESLIKSGEESKAITRTIPTTLFTLNKNGKITSVNETAAEMLGYKEQELIGKSIAEVIKGRVTGNR